MRKNAEESKSSRKILRPDRVMVGIISTARDLCDAQWSPSASTSLLFFPEAGPSPAGGPAPPNQDFLNHFDFQAFLSSLGPKKAIYIYQKRIPFVKKKLFAFELFLSPGHG
jgi:hypothetical protein